MAGVVRELAHGEQLDTTSHGTLTVGDVLGEGGQGVVYAATVGGSADFALKWYHAPADDLAWKHSAALYKQLRQNLEEPPLSDSRFLLPLDVVRKDERYGYLMARFPSRFRSLEELVRGTLSWPKTGPLRPLLTAAMGIADAYGKLHIVGHCYKDINLGGPRLDPSSGEVLICDNDNIWPDRLGGAVFTPQLAAPEVNRGEATCSTLTDRHGLAVLLFYMLVRGNPLEGRRELATVVLEEDAIRRSYASDPLFVFDPNNTANAPLPEEQASLIRNWQALPQFVRDLFVVAFTDGLRNPSRRPSEVEWRAGLARLRDSLSACSHCQRETSVDFVTNSDIPNVRCRLCNRTFQRPPRLRFSKTDLAYSTHAELRGYHLGERDDYFGEPRGRFSQHPNNASVIGLRNDSAQTWVLSDGPGQKRQEVPPGRNAPLANGRRIDFGPTTATVQF